MAIAMFLGANPVPDVQHIVLTVARVDQLFLLLLFVRSECSKPEQLVVTFAAGYIGKLFLVCMTCYFR